MGRDAQILLEHIGGDSLRVIGPRHGLSHEGARQIIGRETHEHIRDIVVNLWQAQRDGQILVLAIPDALASEQDVAIDYLRWVLRELERRWGVRADVHYTPTPSGAIAFGLTDPDPQMPGGER